MAGAIREVKIFSILFGACLTLQIQKHTVQIESENIDS